MTAAEAGMAGEAAPAGAGVEGCVEGAVAVAPAAAAALPGRGVVASRST